MRGDIGTDAGLWISAPTVMESLTLGKTPYLVLGDDTLFDFGGGDRLWIEDLARPSALLGQIDLI